MLGVSAWHEFYKIFYRRLAKSFHVLESMPTFRTILYILIFKGVNDYFYKAKSFEYLLLLIIANRETKFGITTIVFIYWILFY